MSEPKSKKLPGIPVLKVITLARLKKLGACREQVDRFRRVFGGSARITPANLTIAARARLNVRWLVERVVDPKIEHNNTIDGSGCPACKLRKASPRTLLLKAARWEK